MSHLSPGLRTSAVVVLMLKLTLADNGGVETVSVMSLCPCESQSPPPVWVSAGSPAAFYPLCRGNCSCAPVIGFPNVDTDLYYKPNIGT